MSKPRVVAPQWAGMVWEWAENGGGISPPGVEKISDRLPAILPKFSDLGPVTFWFLIFFLGI